MAKRIACTVLAGAVVLGAAAVAPAQSLRDRLGYVRNRAPAGKSRLLGALVYREITVRFEGVPARNVLEHLRRVAGVPLLARYHDDRTGIGLDGDAPIDLDVVDTPVLTVLEMVLEQCTDEGDESTWQLRDGFVEVGPKQRLARARETRYYPVRDLLQAVPSFDNAPAFDLAAALDQYRGAGGGSGGGGGFGGSGGGGGEGGGGGDLFGPPGEEQPRPDEGALAAEVIDVIVTTVEPNAWPTLGGDWASIRYHQGVLIVSAPDFIQRRIGGYPAPARPK